MIQEAIGTLIKNEDLTYDTAAAVMDEIMSGTATDAQKAAFLTALHLKGENIEEITACASIMRKYCAIFDNTVPEVIDIVGTGGDCAGTFNISTLASIVVSAAGAKVAKHGNRAASSKCGTADVLEHLGVNLMADAKVSQRALEELGICFLFAQNYHLAMKYVAPVRKELGIRTVFNILGPLTNPAGASMQVMGVYDESLVEPLARVLTNLGVKSAMVVFGQDVLDEISISAPTTVCEVKNGHYDSYVIEPEQFGFQKCSKADLTGGTPEENAAITIEVLNGEKGPKRNAVVLNAGAGLYVAGKALSLAEGVHMAEHIIDSGAAKARLHDFIRLSNENK